MLSSLMNPNRQNLGNKLIYNLALYCSGKLDDLILEGILHQSNTSCHQPSNPLSPPLLLLLLLLSILVFFTLCAWIYSQHYSFRWNKARWQNLETRFTCLIVFAWIIAKNNPKNHKFQKNHPILDECVHIWMRFYNIIHMWLHHSNDCRHFGFLEILKQKEVGHDLPMGEV